MKTVPKWALLTSGCAPVLFTAGWVFAAHLAGPTYDPIKQTISVLTSYGEAGKVITVALVVLGVCHLLTAWGLRAGTVLGRMTLAGGGVAALAVAMIPAPASGGSLRHGTAAAIGFVLLSLWPILCSANGDNAPWALRRKPSIAAMLVILLGGTWFLLESLGGGDLGIAERFVTDVQSLWPFVVVLSCLRHARNPVEL